MLYPKPIVDFVQASPEHRARFPFVARHDALHVATDTGADPDHDFERWMLSEGWRSAAEIRRYLHFQSSMLAVFRSIERRFPRTDLDRSGRKDECSVQTSVDEMMVLARYLYYLDSHGVPGDVLECGCFKGFSSCCLSWVCSYLGRKLIVADSFEGLPDDATQDYYETSEFKGAFEEVRSNLSSMGRFESVELVRGFFADSLPGFDRPLALIWMDVDLYSSAKDVLENTFPCLQAGGVVFSHELFDGRDFRCGRLVDEAGPAKALHEFYGGRGIDYAAVFCEGCLGLTVPGTAGPLAFSQAKQRFTQQALSTESRSGFGPQQGALRRSLRGLKRVPLLGPGLGAARGLIRRLSGR